MPLFFITTRTLALVFNKKGFPTEEVSVPTKDDVGVMVTRRDEVKIGGSKKVIW